MKTRRAYPAALVLLVLAVTIQVKAQVPFPDFSKITSVHTYIKPSSTTYQSGSDLVIPRRVETSCGSDGCESTESPEVDSPSYATISGVAVSTIVGGQTWTFILVCNSDQARCAPLQNKSDSDSDYGVRFYGSKSFDCETALSQENTPLEMCKSATAPQKMELVYAVIDKHGRKKNKKSTYEITSFSNTTQFDKAGKVDVFYTGS